LLIDAIASWYISVCNRKTAKVNREHKSSYLVSLEQLWHAAPHSCNRQHYLHSSTLLQLNSLHFRLYSSSFRLCNNILVKLVRLSLTLPYSFIEKLTQFKQSSAKTIRSHKNVLADSEPRESRAK